MNDKYCEEAICILSDAADAAGCKPLGLVDKIESMKSELNECQQNLFKALMGDASDQYQAEKYLWLNRHDLYKNLPEHKTHEKEILEQLHKIQENLRKFGATGI